MGILIDNTDFIGKYELNSNLTDTIDSYIELHEKQVIYKMLGKELCDLFIADVDSITKLPVTQKYLDIYNALVVENEYGQKYSHGMKAIVLGYIYFFYVTESKYLNTGTGMKVFSSELTRDADFTEEYVYKNMNDSVNYSKAVQYYITQKLDIYPEFNGFNLEYVYWC